MENYKSTYEIVRDEEELWNANLIASHVLYKVTKDEDGALLLKATILPYGNRNLMKDDVTKDSTTAHVHVIILMLAVIFMIPLRMGLIDISRAYLQSGPICWTIFVRPPKELLDVPRRCIWQLTKFLYAITEAGQQ